MCGFRGGGGAGGPDPPKKSQKYRVSSVSLSLSHWYPGSGVVLDCIDS